MSIICIKNVPIDWNQRHVTLQLGKAVIHKFVTIKFIKGNASGKQLYLRLCDNVDPLRVIEDINRASKRLKLNLFAHTAMHIPGLAEVGNTRSENKKKKALSAPPPPPDQTLESAHSGIMIELQCKYTGLYGLSQKTDHMLLVEISKTVFERLRHIMETNMEYAKTSFFLTKAYRRSYPHFGDFQLVLSTLHSVEDSRGSPRTQLLEHELAAPLKEYPVIGNIPFAKVEKTCHKYANKIEQKIIEHVKNLPTDPESDPPTAEDLAKCRVRAELKKTVPYMGYMLRQLVTADFASPKSAGKRNIRMKIYGEPYLPTRDLLAPVLKPFDAKRFVRSDQIYNMVAFTMGQRHYSRLMALDGTELGGARLVIRKSEKMPCYTPPKDMLKKMMNTFDNFEDVPEPDMNDEDMEDWGEEL